MKYYKKYQHVTRRHKVSTCCWKNGVDSLAQCRVATNFQSVKNSVTAKCNKKWYSVYNCVSCGCQQKLAQTWWHKTKEIHAHSSGGQKSEIKVLAGPCSIQSPLRMSLPYLFYLQVAPGIPGLWQHNSNLCL